MQNILLRLQGLELQHQGITGRRGGLGGGGPRV
jgi:hypothetical protein